MHFMIQFSCDGVVPRERLGPIPQLFVGASPEQGAKALMTHGKVVENNTIDWSEFTMLARTTEQSGMSSHGARNVIYRLDERS